VLDVWTIDLARETPRIALHRTRLSADEHALAARFRREEDRARFIVGRSTRKELLSELVGVDAAALDFVAGGNGKPLLAAGAGGLHFNSSHSGRWILHAFSDAEVGVDVEEIRAAMAVVEDFESVLSADERSFVMRQAAPARRAAALATVWVRKEAYVKALGEGLSRPLPRISIVQEPGGQPVLRHDLDCPAAVHRWCFTDLQIDATHKACVVHEAPRAEPVVRRYLRQ
jgi:4'-phosphopantetheinyl transferase